MIVGIRLLKVDNTGRAKLQYTEQPWPEAEWHDVPIFDKDGNKMSNVNIYLTPVLVESWPKGDDK